MAKKAKADTSATKATQPKAAAPAQKAAAPAKKTDPVPAKKAAPVPAPAPASASAPALAKSKKNAANVVQAPAKKSTKAKGKSRSTRDTDDEIVYEFGGPLGTFFIMVFSPFILYYLWECLYFNSGGLLYPASISEIPTFFSDFFGHIINDAPPTIYAAKVYIFFCLFELILTWVLPGPKVKGLPIPTENGKQLVYTCNGVTCLYITMVTSVILHFTGIFRITEIVDNFGSIMTMSIIVGFVITFVTYFVTILMNKQIRMSGNFVYDLFMGAPLNPRLGSLDLKMWAEIRIPWVLLFYISVSALVKQYEEFGYVTAPLVFMVVAHFLYVNACQKGEECIPTSWDIFYEKWGFMLIFWNMSGVPFMYSYSSIFLWKLPVPLTHSTPYTIMCFVLLFGAYYVWDTANSQKNRFRMKLAGTYIPRKTFPQLPWGTLENPSFIKTKQGSLLLTSGWWGIARKIHYTADLVMSLTWGLITGFTSFIPYWYTLFFFFVLTHRCIRDMERCAKKYGEDWERYCKIVPYRFIPYVY